MVDEQGEHRIELACLKDQSWLSRHTEQQVRIDDDHRFHARNLIMKKSGDRLFGLLPLLAHQLRPVVNFAAW